VDSNRYSLQEDLSKTVNELSDVYEELSLLYRFSGSISGLDVDDICLKVVDEAISSVETETAAVLLLDEDLNELVTHSATGTWDSSLQVKLDGSVFWKAIAKRSPVCINKMSGHDLSGSLPGLGSLVICPMTGKKKVIGVLVVADKTDGGDFYSNDVKLSHAISQQAALFIENAVLNKEMEHFLIGTIKSFVKALEASSFWTAGHTERVTDYALAIGREIGISPVEHERLKICCLFHDIGKIATPKEILNKAGELTEEERQVIRRHPSTGASILEGLEKFTDIVECIKYHHEHYDGSESIHGLMGEDIPLPARILAVADAFDALTSDRPYRKKRSIREAITEIHDCSGTQFDPNVVFAFTKWAENRFSTIETIS
jgi:putative nucleotidyltransferase with HDIG domain